MPKAKTSLIAKLDKFFNEFGSNVFSTDGTSLFCKSCKTTEFCKKYYVTMHCKRAKHQTAVARVQSLQQANDSLPQPSTSGNALRSALRKSMSKPTTMIPP